MSFGGGTYGVILPLAVFTVFILKTQYQVRAEVLSVECTPNRSINNNLLHYYLRPTPSTILFSAQVSTKYFKNFSRVNMPRSLYSNSSSNTLLRSCSVPVQPSGSIPLYPALYIHRAGQFCKHSSTKLSCLLSSLGLNKVINIKLETPVIIYIMGFYVLNYSPWGVVIC